MRTSLAFLTVLATVSLSPVAPATADSPAGRLLKGVGKHAVNLSDVFNPDFKPKRLCYCRTGAQSRRIGFLVYSDAGFNLLCGVPSTISPEGQLIVVDYGCEDFELIGR